MQKRCVIVKRKEEIKVKLQFDYLYSINSVRLTKALHDAVGSVSQCKGWSLVITCNDIKQQDDRSFD